MEEIGLKAVMDMVGFTAGMNAYNQKLGEASSNTDKHAGLISKAFSAIGTAAVGLAAAGIAAVTTAVVGGIAAATSWAEKLNDVSNVLGTTTEESAMLAVAAQHIGGNVEQLTSQLAFMARGLQTADGKIGPTGKALNALGINFLDVNGKVRPTTELLQEAANKINAMPPGLEKTTAMMSLFGKSGKDMSDMLEVLAGTGMADMDAKAKALGLSLSGDAANGAEQFGRSLNDLKMVGQGLLVTIGSALLPILQPLAEEFAKLASEAIPYVRQAIEDLMPYVKQVVAWVGEQMPGAIQIASDLWDKVLRPILNLVYVVIRDALIPIIKEVVAWLAEYLPPAIQKAADFWNNTLKPAVEAIWKFIREQLFPVFADVVKWLAENIPPAIEKAASWFNDHILPALKDVWAFIKDPLLPILGDIVTWLVEGIKTAVTTFVTDIWPKVKEAFSAVKDFIEDPLLPTLAKIIDWLATAIGKAIDTFKLVWGGIKEAFEKVANFISGPNGLIENFNKVYNFLAGGFDKAVATFKQVLQPVIDIWNTIKSIIQWIIENAEKAINLAKGAGGNSGNNPNPGGGGKGRTGTDNFMGGGSSGGGGMIVSNNNTVNIYLTASINNGMDLEAFRVTVLDTVKGALI